ncbi:hypothetical protein J7T55_007339 [Diaporthe amygdali]|uniref:uncharacterized protein n=1 Tax=Phomopsis amygdali TaxID=1214568 RepID=UPI0022FF0C30|nr:uncharacterized protein J7T55_007339 [Diaporthe amygdali]KAJ0116359.1 hypothetical protein J7T55_007339 [Diaporthe amygdali]
MVSFKASMFSGAGMAGDTQVIAAAREMFSQRIGGDEEAIHPSLRLEVFGIVAEHGSRQELEKLLDVWRSSPSDIERYQALQCLGHASTVELITWVLKLALTRDVKDQDLMASSAHGAVQLWNWMKVNWGRVETSVPVDLRCVILGVVLDGLSTEEHIADVRAYFKARDSEAYHQVLEQRLERMEVRRSWAERDAEDVKAWLESHGYLHNSEQDGEEPRTIEFSKEDDGNPRAWPRSKKLTNIAVVAMMAILSPLASSMFTPGINSIAEDLGTTMNVVIGATTGFTVMLGFGPLILAPLSETFGRRKLYLSCFSVFTLLQIPTALSPNVETLIAMRVLSGAVGSVGIANGGGTISDMFEPHERAGVYGWYLLGPLLGPTIGPLFGGLIVQRLGWRWIFWTLAIVCGINTMAGFLFLRETYAPVILEARMRDLENDGGRPGRYRFAGQDTRPLSSRLATAFSRPFRIFIQPIVLTLSLYQALIFGTTYSLYTNFEAIYSGIYGFNTEQVGLLYLFPGVGFLIAVRLIVPRIDDVYIALTRRNNDISKPEFRLPLANIGAILVPASLFWFAWTVEFEAPWLATITSTLFYGVGQVLIVSCVQNYYIDSFEKYAASAIAAGAVFRSVVGGITPLLAPSIFDALGYGWGVSVFAFLAVALAPAPVVFYTFGERIRQKYHVELDR